MIKVPIINDDYGFNMIKGIDGAPCGSIEILEIDNGYIVALISDDDHRYNGI